MNNIVKYKDLLAFQPGSYVEDIIDDLNITQAEFANRLGVSPKTVSKLVNGEDKLSPSLALKLEYLTGVEYNTRMSLQNAYDRKILEIQAEKEKDEDRIVSLIDSKYFKNLGLLSEKRYSMAEKKSLYRQILNVSDLTYLLRFNPLVSYRNTGDFSDKVVVNSNVMLELASNLARDKTDKKLDREKLREYLPTIRNMVTENPSQFLDELREILLDCGVVLVTLPKLRGAMLNGATKKFNNGSVLLLITDKNKGADIFWFSLMHEIGHILNKDFYTDKDDLEAYKNKERIADHFAEDFFIPLEDYKKFVGKADFRKEEILKFSKNQGIIPCILLGRLKKDKYLGYEVFSDLMEKYEIQESLSYKTNDR